jgi:hypothetical protein
MAYNSRAYMRAVMDSFNEATPMATTHPDNHAYGQLHGRESMRSFVLAGHSTFTLVSKSTGRRFTYKVNSATKDRNQNWSTNNQNRDLFFVSVLTGSDNESSYQYIGMLRRNGHDNNDTRFPFIYGGAKAKVRRDANSVKGFEWFWSRMEAFANVDGLMEFWHEGKCGRCGRKLTVPSSIESGIGPECANKGEGDG